MEIFIIILVGLLIFIIPVAVIALIVQAIARKNNKDEKKDFDQVIRSAYIYLILIITLIAIITAFIDTFRVGLDVLLPEKSISDSVYNSLEREKNGNIVALLTNMSMLITMIPIFIYHNKLVKKAKKVKEA